MQYKVRSLALWRGGACRSLVVLCLFHIGCGPNPAVLMDPGKVPEGRGIAFGRVRVFKGDAEVTGACQIRFQNEEREGTGAYSLDESGWVFASLPSQMNYLYFVNCAVWNGLDYATHDVYFFVNAAGDGVYFGDVTFRLANDDLKTSLEVVAHSSQVGGLLHSGLLAAASKVEAGGNEVFVDNKFDEAVRAFAKRFGSTPHVAWLSPKMNAGTQRVAAPVTGPQVEPPPEDPGALVGDGPQAGGDDVPSDRTQEASPDAPGSEANATTQQR